MTDILRSSNFCVISWDTLMDECCTWDIDSMLHTNWLHHHEHCLMDECHIWDIVSMLYLRYWFHVTHQLTSSSWALFDGWMSYLGYCFYVTKDWADNICRAMWPVFCGPVILPYKLNIIWWIDVGILVSCDRKIDFIWYAGLCDLYFAV